LPSDAVQSGEINAELASQLHIPVLLNEAVDSLNIKPGGTYVDGTFGRGGHAKEILKRLNEEGLLVAIDKDPRAVLEGKKIESKNFKIFHGTFKDVKTILSAIGISHVDGILLDLGVSSPQIDNPLRGFSFSNDGPLDMRMDTKKGQTAEEWLNSAPQSEIVRVLKVYGEERFAPRVAQFIIETRVTERLTTTNQLRRVVERAIPRKFHINTGRNPATKTFQAIRIHLNRELDDLEDFLGQASSVLLSGARLVIISFHSLEDRIVKHFIARESKPNVPDRVPIREVDLPKTPLRAMGKAVRPTDNEVDRNPRSRSAILRVAERNGP
jgi:16S rRNA (cytosine1402-N4)-methyltransferase